jgi:hypothetical protein
VADMPLTAGNHIEVISADATTLTIKKLDV